DDAEIAAVIKYALRANPESTQEIQTLADGWQAQKATVTLQEAQTRVLVEAASAQVPAPSAPWKGKLELGGFYATGNSDYVGLTAGVNLRQEGKKWRHILIAQGDYQENAGDTTRERFLASYQPNYRFSES